MPDWWNRYVFLILGGIALTAAAVWTHAGKAWIRFHGWVYRAQEPKRFWLEVGTYYLIGVVFVFIGILQYLAH